MKLFFVAVAAIAFVAAGIVKMYGRERLALIFGTISLISGLASGGIWYLGKRSEKMLKIKNAEFHADVENADRASAMEVNVPASFSGVKASLTAKNVKDAAVFRTNQGLIATFGFCSVKQRQIPLAMTGQEMPETFVCPLCGQEHSLNKK